MIMIVVVLDIYSQLTWDFLAVFRLFLVRHPNITKLHSMSNSMTGTGDQTPDLKWRYADYTTTASLLFYDLFGNLAIKHRN